MLSYSDFENMAARIDNIISQEVSVVFDKSEFPPTIEDLEDNNKTYSLDAAVLFIDIRHSTNIMDDNTPETMVKIYRAFMRSMVECVRKNGGVTRQFLGDRIMGIFKALPDDELSASDKAINAAIDMQTAVDYILNKHFREKLDGPVISCGIGIDYGNILVTKVGMHGLEANEEKEDEFDFVWVGSATNHASKYADVAQGSSVFISDACYENIKAIDKSPWEKKTCNKGNLVLKGYLCHHVYSKTIDGFGDAVSADDELSMLEENALIEAIHELEKQHDKLIIREREISVKESEFEKTKSNLQTRVNTMSDKIDELSEKNTDLSDNLRNDRSKYYDCLSKIIGSWHCSSNSYKEQFRKDDVWRYYINESYTVGKKLGYSQDQVTSRNECGLMEMYMFMKEPEKAYEALLVMASKNNYWLNLRQDVVEWAKNNDKLSTLIYRIEDRLNRFELPLDKRNDFYGYAKKLRAIRGY